MDPVWSGLLLTAFERDTTRVTVFPEDGSSLMQAFHKAGLPPGVINLVTGKGSEIGDYLTTHPAVNCIRC